MIGLQLPETLFGRSEEDFFGGRLGQEPAGELGGQGEPVRGMGLAQELFGAVVDGRRVDRPDTVRMQLVQRGLHVGERGVADLADEGATAVDELDLFYRHFCFSHSTRY